MKSRSKLFVWNAIAVLGLLIPAILAEAALRYREPMMRWGTNSVLVYKINHYKNRVGMKYLTIAGNIQTLPVRLYCRLTGQEYLEAYTYPEIMTAEKRNEFLDELRLVMDEPDSLPVWDELFESYQTMLDEYRASLAVNSSDMVLMYVPAGNYAQPVTRIERSRELFERLVGSGEYVVWDLLPVFHNYAVERTTYEPTDGHYRPLGHQLVASYVEQRLAERPVNAQARRFNTRPSVLGDLDPHFHQVDKSRSDISVYEIKVNAQGLRHDTELQFPKSKPRVAFYGDSMTIGYYVNNDQTWGHLLNKSVPQYEFIVTGKSGCTLPDYLYSYNDHGKFLEADLVVVTFNDSDLIDMLDPFRRLVTLDPKARRGSVLSKAQQSVIDRALERLKQRRHDAPKPLPPNSKIVVK